MNALLTNKTVKCKKKHRCDWCGEVIEPGEIASYRSGIFEGEFFNGHMHLECYSAMNSSDRDDFEDGGFDPMCQKRGKTMRESHE